MEDHEIQVDQEALAQAFVAEAGENLCAMEQALVALESRPGDEELVHSLFRSAHTLKGSASLVAFDAVRDLAHDLEALLERVRAKELRPEPALVTLLLQSVDVLRAAVVESAHGRTGSTPELEAFRERIRNAATGSAPSTAAAPALEAAVPAAAGSPRSLRIGVSKLDRMLDLSGEIAIARSRLTDMLERRTGLAAGQILEAHREADRLYRDLQDLIMKARMVPLGPVFQQHYRTVRDIAGAQGKQVRLILEGEDVEVDTAVVEHIRDPLTHMVRNAVDHGIESPEARRLQGKDPVGRVLLRAFHDGGSVLVSVEDDGAGFARARIAERAEALGLVANASAVTDEDVAQLVFEPGLSTSQAVTEISGRGVGMDVVRRNVEGLGGSVDAQSRPGGGTSVNIRLPLTLAIIQGFQVTVADETYIIPLDAVSRCLELPPGERAGRDGTGVVRLEGRPLPYLRLREHFGIGGTPPQRQNMVVIRHGGTTAGLAVDELQGESQTVIKPLGRMFQGLPGVSGSSILGDGRVALILDVAGLLRETLKRAAASSSA